MINKNKKGFSLLETIIYLAIVGILLTAAVSLHLTLGGTSDKLTSNILVSRNRQVALSAIDYLVSNSEGLLRDLNSTCSNIGATPPVLALYFDDDTYLPGTCVGSGGGVRISVGDKKLKLTCYPNIPQNGYYLACNTTTYPAENVYYLSSPDVEVLNSSLSFATSTATSTANNFVSLTSKLSVGTPYNDQIALRATSTASSTSILRNEDAWGLISWWISNNPNWYTDSQGSNNLSCSGPGLTQYFLPGDDEWAFDFNNDTDYCSVSDDDSLNFNNAFTISTWIRPDTLGPDQGLILKQSTSTLRGYGLYVDSGEAMLSICDTNSCQEMNDTSFTMSTGVTYNVTATYDLSGDEAVIYVYQKSVGGVGTSTFHSLNTLVNYNGNLTWTTSTAAYSFDGPMDHVRIYNRALSAEEIWAIQSQGA